MKSLWRNSPTKNFTILFRKQCKYKTSSEVIILNLEDGCLANKWNKGITDFGHKSSACLLVCSICCNFVWWSLTGKM